MRKWRFALCLLLLIVFQQGMAHLNKTLRGNGLTEVDVQQIYNNLKQYTGEPDVTPPIYVVKSDEVNAYNDGSGIYITSAMLNFVHNKDELALVIGHEIGHTFLGHLDPNNTMTDDSRYHETNADRYGLFLMMRAGYDPCAGETMWQHMREWYGDGMITVSHPGESQRVWSFAFPMCHPWYKEIKI